MGGEADVVARFEEGFKEQPEGVASQAGAMAREGKEGGELGVIGELHPGAFECGNGFGRAPQAKKGGGAADQGVGLLGGCGKAERERALVGGEGLGVRALRCKGESLLGGDLGHVRVAGIEVAQGGQQGGDEKGGERKEVFYAHGVTWVECC